MRLARGESGVEKEKAHNARSRESFAHGEPDSRIATYVVRDHHVSRDL